MEEPERGIAERALWVVLVLMAVFAAALLWSQ